MKVERRLSRKRKGLGGEGRTREYDQSTLYTCMKMSYETHCYTINNANKKKRKEHLHLSGYRQVIKETNKFTYLIICPHAKTV
jgi:hypothetical protein